MSTMSSISSWQMVAVAAVFAAGCSIDKPSDQVAFKVSDAVVVKAKVAALGK